MQQHQIPQWFTARKRALAILPFLSFSLLAEQHYEQASPEGQFLGATVPDPHHDDLQAPASKISVELLRYPLPGKARHMLLKSENLIRSGHHQAAIEILEKALAKYPASAAYTQSLLGVEYLRVDRYSDASNSLQQAVDLLPHDAVNHYNLGLSFVFTHQLDRAKQELHRALQLDPHISPATRLLAALPAAP